MALLRPVRGVDRAVVQSDAARVVGGEEETFVVASADWYRAGATAPLTVSANATARAGDIVLRAARTGSFHATVRRFDGAPLPRVVTVTAVSEKEAGTMHFLVELAESLFRGFVRTRSRFEPGARIKVKVEGANPRRGEVALSTA